MLLEINSWDLRYESVPRCRTRSGGELYFERYGADDGPALVFVNNFFIIAPAWRNFTKELRQNFGVLAYDLQNQGASSQPGTSFAFSGHAEDLRDLLDHLNIERAYLVGTSISTLIVRRFAALYPERVAGLILTGPAHSPYGHFRLRLLVKDWLARLEAGGPEFLFNYLYPIIFTDQTVESGGAATYLALRERFLALNSHEQIESCLMGIRSLARAEPEETTITSPTLIIIGDSDYLWSASTLQVATGSADVEGVVISQAGHLPFFEQVDAFEAAVAAFVSRAEQDGSGRAGQ